MEEAARNEGISGRITFDYTATAYDTASFRAHGAMVAVVLNYNKKGLIGAAVRSALEQDWPCYEVLAMDDASTDGSEAELLDAVRSWVAAHPEKAVRVRVVVNETNQTTLGQWRQAVRMSEGEWFGMFCGDDVALPKRMAIAAKTIAAHPQAAGIATNYYRGESDEMALDTSGETRFCPGCTAFWSRRVLLADLPRGMMDDWTLSWVIRILQAGELVLERNEATVRYTVGTGVTTDLTAGAQGLLEKYRAVIARGKRFGRKVWDPILLFDAKYGTDARLSREIRGWWVLSATEGGGWWARLGAVATILIADCGNDYGGKRREIVKKALGRLITRFFGRWSFYWSYRLFGRMANDSL